MNRRGFFGRLASLTGAAVLLPKALPPEEAPPFPDLFPPDKNPVEKPQLDHFYDALPYSFGTTSVSLLEADLWPRQTMVRRVILCDYCGSRRPADPTTCPGCGAP